MMAKKIFLIAGEISGDLLGAALMRDIKAVAGDDEVVFSGVGGTGMTAQGLDSLFPMTDLSVMGLFEVLKHFPKLYNRFNQTVDAILDQNPDVLVTIDAPDFGLRVAKKIKSLRPEIQCIHYVAPTVWAWRPKRAEKIARFLDGVMCLFPFEPKYFQPHGLRAGFVGHPLTRIIPDQFDKAGFCARHGLDPNRPILSLLPGSRIREVDALGPIMVDVIDRIKQTAPQTQFILPGLPHVLPYLGELKKRAYVFVPATDAEKYNAFAASDTALHASGTVALELALCGTPMVTIYKMSPITAWVARRVLLTPYANLVNILLQHPVVPELIQDEANADHITPMVQALLGNEALNTLQREELKRVANYLHEDMPHAAARFVLGD